MAKSTEQSTNAAPVRAPILPPRFVMGIAVTLLPFGILPPHARTPVQSIHDPEFSLVRLWNAAEDTVTRVESRAINDYENILLVYQLERRVEADNKRPLHSRGALKG